MFCNKCGAQFEEGTAFCQQCGNDLNAVVAVKEEEAAPTPVSPVPTPVVPVKKDKKKLVLILVAAVVATALIVVGAIFIPKAVKANKVAKLEESLVGETFRYIERPNTHIEFTFKKDGRCIRNFHYGYLVTEWDYVIKYISKDEIVLCIGSDRFDGGFNTIMEYAIDVNRDGDAVLSFSEIDNDDVVFFK